MTTKNLAFGAFHLDTARRLLTRTTGEAVSLTPKAFELLLILVDSEGRLLTKADLMNRMWPDSFVEDGNLTQTVSVLRKALGEHPHQHLYIVTEPRQGYRFVAEVGEAQQSYHEWGEETSIDSARVSDNSGNETAHRELNTVIPGRIGSVLGRNGVIVAAVGLVVVFLLGLAWPICEHIRRNRPNRT